VRPTEETTMATTVSRTFRDHDLPAPTWLAVSTNSFHGYPLETALAGIAAAGFASVEICSVPGWTEHVPRDATDSEIARIEEALAKHGLTPTALSGHSELTTDEGAAAFRQALRLCGVFGIAQIATGTGGHNAAPESALAAQRAAFLLRIGPLADEAAAAGITICLETHGGLLATGAMAAELIERIDKPNVGINYDTGNVVYYGDIRPEEDIATAAPYIKHLHIKDQIGGKGVWNFPPIGTGDVDFVPIFARLKRAGVQVPASIELEFQGEPWPRPAEITEALVESRQFLRRCT
jgi:L-ribulose-5-phosphate 3-epimerase